MVEKCYVVPRLAVPAIRGTAFINDDVWAIFPRHQRVYWTADMGNDNPTTPILATREGGVHHSLYDVKPAKVHLAKAIRSPPRVKWWQWRTPAQTAWHYSSRTHACRSRGVWRSHTGS